MTGMRAAVEALRQEMIGLRNAGAPLVGRDWVEHRCDQILTEPEPKFPTTGWAAHVATLRRPMDPMEIAGIRERDTAAIPRFGNRDNDPLLRAEMDRRLLLAEYDHLRGLSASTEWPCANYAAPETCITAQPQSSPVARCPHCHRQAAAIYGAALSEGELRARLIDLLAQPKWKGTNSKTARRLKRAVRTILETPREDT